jgi:hypothetical protein
MAAGTTATVDRDALEHAIRHLAGIYRPSASPGEREAAEWIANRLEVAGCAAARIEEEQFLDGYAPLIGALSAAGALIGVGHLARARRHPGGRCARAAATAAALTAGAIADDISNGPRIARRAAIKPKTTWNVVAECSDMQADRTLVVVAHHDAAPTGAIFDDTVQSTLGDMFPGVLERIDTSLPLWWPVLAGPGLVALGAARGRKRLVRTGIALALTAAAAFADIARSPTVPGANDNLTAVALLVALAERLAAEPVEGLRVMLVSCGAEEVIQGGIYGFAERHVPALDRDRTWFVVADTIGSPRLVLLEGEGPVVMEDYTDRRFRDLVARAAEEAGAQMRRGMRARNSTDAVIPSRAGYPTVALASTDRYKALSNYHTMADTPENVDYRTVEQALVVTEAVARRLAVDPWLTR